MSDGSDVAPVPEYTTHAEARDNPSGGTIGPYRLLQRVGEGGMGEVWLAEQLSPIHRRVALKIIKAGMDSAQVVARFEAERQALALMSHPAIAQVFDAGTTLQGRPYFVMEYVAGEPITTYCKRHRLPLRARLDLVLELCEGVHHAHQKGIIHRDLKPSNILVTVRDERPAVKIIDFGVAKATTRSLADRELHTEFGLMIGTPEYMSPEQAEMSGLDVDTRTDVYAVGVVLYELLTGTLPFDSATLRAMSIDEVRRRIREVDPPRPSRRATTIAATRRETAPADPGASAKELRGDLDWITLRALDKDRTRRYGSVSDLAADLRRHLQHLPVLAGPPSTVYRARKFVRRHRLAVTAAGTLVALLAAFAWTAVLQARRTASERDRANREAQASKQISDFLLGLFRVANPRDGRGSSVTARELLDQGAQRISGELAGQPEVRARLLSTMANAYLSLGILDRAAPLVDEAWKTRRQLFGERAAETLQSVNQRGVLAYSAGRLRDAEALFREALAGNRSVLGPTDPETLNSLANLGGVLMAQGRYADAEPIVKEALENTRQRVGPDALRTLNAQNNLGTLLVFEGKLTNAEQVYRDGLQRAEAALGRDQPTSISLRYNLANVLERQGRVQDAERYYRETLDLRRARLGPNHADTLMAMSSLGGVLHKEGRDREAEELIRSALAGTRTALGQNHPRVGGALVDLAMVLNGQGKYAEAEAAAREGLHLREQAGSASRFNVGEAQSVLGESLTGQGKFVEAERYVRDGADAVLASSEATPAGRREALERAVRLYAHWNKIAQAAEWKEKLAAEVALQQSPR